MVINGLTEGVTFLACFVSQCVETVLAAIAQNYSCEFSTRDVHRMELIVMQKLDFKLNSYTLYDFLKIVSQIETGGGGLRGGLLL